MESETLRFSVAISRRACASTSLTYELRCQNPAGSALLISGRCRQLQPTKSTDSLDYLFENIFLTIFMAVPREIEKQIYPSRSLTDGLCRYLHVDEVRLLTYLSFPFFLRGRS